MTTLVYQKLSTELEQEFNLKNNTRYQIACVSPYLFMFNSPSGTFSVELIEGVTTLKTWTFSSVDIKTSLSTMDDYCHVFFPLTSTTPFPLAKGSYKLKLSATGYSATSSSFLGWIQQHEDLNNELDYTPTNDEENPLAIRIKIFKEGIK